MKKKRAQQWRATCSVTHITVYHGVDVCQAAALVANHNSRKFLKIEDFRSKPQQPSGPWAIFFGPRHVTEKKKDVQKRGIAPAISHFRMPLVVRRLRHMAIRERSECVCLWHDTNRVHHLHQPFSVRTLFESIRWMLQSFFASWHSRNSWQWGKLLLYDDAAHVDETDNNFHYFARGFLNSFICCFGFRKRYMGLILISGQENLISAAPRGN